MAAEDPFAPFAQNYAIHEESYGHMRQMVAMGGRPYSELGVEAAREQLEKIGRTLGGTMDFDGEEKEIFIQSPHCKTGIPVSVYKPASCGKNPIILVWFHGGGLVIGSRRTHEATLKVIARDSKAIVVNVEYRRLPNPDCPYAPFDDAEVATQWVLEHKEAIGGSSVSKVGVGGDSAGGHLSIGVTNEIRGLDFQVLVYPMSDTAKTNDTFREFKDVPCLNENAINFFFSNSLEHLADYLTNPRINGMVRTNTELSPPALIVLAELDPLRGCGLDYAEKLRQAGVPVEVQIIQGIPHSFFSLRTVYKTKCPEAYAHIVKFLHQFQ